MLFSCPRCTGAHLASQNRNFARSCPLPSRSCPLPAARQNLPTANQKLPTRNSEQMLPTGPPSVATLGCIPIC